MSSDLNPAAMLSGGTRGATFSCRPERRGAISRFVGEYAFLSNFYLRPIADSRGTIWPSAEHAFHACKTHDQRVREWIREAADARQAKQRGRNVRMAVVMRPDWDSVRVPIMAAIVRAKFGQHVDLAARLLSTDPAALVEGNDWGDTYWGVCNGVGQNVLGVILMRVRDELRAQTAADS